VKIAVVVQRYGADINGGAELHARYVAEHLARHVEVEVLTTCARDYITWANDYPPGQSREAGVDIRRFPVSRTRSPQDFGAWSRRVFETTHSVNDELAWLEAEGPTSPALIRHLTAQQASYDYVLFFSMRYYHAWHGARAVPDKAILVPTAERDDVLGLEIFRPILRGVRACMYNSPEERALLQAMAGRDDVPGVVVGVGSELPASASAERFRQRTGIHDRIAIYIGRIDENKGCAELFDYWIRYSEITPGGLTLVLVGTPVLPVPVHPRIRHLGFVTDAEKFDALEAAEFLLMPSYFESLSMVALEAWGMGKPVLANGRCDVLRGQAMRSNAGLYYESYAEFVEAVRVLDGSAGVAATLGRNGRRFFQANYTWPIIERKYLDMFARLSREPAADRAARTMEPVPGWWRRRQRTLPPAREVLTQLPNGPVRAAAGRTESMATEGRPPAAASPAIERRPPMGGRQPRPDRGAHGGRGDRQDRGDRGGRGELRDRPPRQVRPASERSGQDRSGQERQGRERQPQGRPAQPRSEQRGQQQGRDRQERGERAIRPAPPADPAAPGPPAAAAARTGGRGRNRRGRSPRGPAGKQGA
jgi:glycosyltransferase involved in cell wall biosynthesis